MYYLFDSCGKCYYKWPFSTYSEAYNFKMLMGRPDWKIKFINNK